jgi:hypothetical protein
MMGTSADPGQVMGRLWADAPGPRVSASQASRDGDEIPAGARIDRAARTITFTTGRVRLMVLATTTTHAPLARVGQVARMPKRRPMLRSRAWVRSRVCRCDPGHL